jgi:tetratricopeptide (TPR) repeat protein
MQLKCNSCGAVQSLSETSKCTYCSNEIVIEKAKEFYDTSISSESGSLIMIAETALDAGNNKEAIDYYNKSIEKVLTNSDAWLGKGIATLYSSTLGDIKIMEAISYWKNAIKFATDQNAMQRRVSTIINNAVLTFYPNIENHYREFKDVKNAYTEFVNKFLLLENALSFAISIDDDNLIVLENGYDLCQKVINAYGKYNKSGSSSSFDKETNEILNNLSKSIESLTVPKELYEIEKKYVDALNKLDSTKNLVSQKEIKEKAKDAKEKRVAKEKAEINENTNKFSKKGLIIGFVGFLIAGIIGNIPGGQVIIFSIVGGLTGWFFGIIIANPKK